MSDPFRTDDIDLHRVITDVDCGDGRAVCAVNEVDAENDGYTSALWLLPFDAAPRRLTAGTARDELPKFSPDATRIAFVSTRTGEPQIHLIDPDGGEARAVGHFPKGVVSFAWHPDGKRLLVTAPVAVDPDHQDADNRDDDAERDADAPEIAWRLPYKADGLGYTLDREIDLFTLDLESGDTRRLTHGAFDVRGAAWSPDGKHIVFTRTREGRMAHRTDAWTLDVDADHAQRLSEDVASVQFPVWSPDGRHIVFSGGREDGDAVTNLWLADVADRRVRRIGGDDLELDAGDTVAWSADSASVLLARAHRGLHEVVRVAIPDGSVDVLAGGPRQAARLAHRAGATVFVASAIDAPAEVYLLRDGDERRLSDFNAWWHTRVQPEVTQREFTVPCEDGSETVLGWLVLPPGCRGPVPLLVYLHGGPASHVLLDYPSHPYWNTLWSRGWAVLALDAVGSNSYGRDFARRLIGHWGERDLPQHLAAVKALQDEGIADARVAVTGKSYGGYLSAWAIGQTSTFRAAVIGAPISNLETHYGTSDSGYYADHHSLGGAPIEGSARSRRLSPMHHASCAVTPTLILQGKDDERCPICQAEALYTVLMTATSVPCEMALYPKGGHHFFETGKPSHRRDAAQRLVDWVERWIDTELPPREGNRRVGASGEPCAADDAADAAGTGETKVD